MKRLAILGATGSIGTSTLKIVDRYPDRFQVVALSAWKNVGALSALIKKYQPTVAVIGTTSLAEQLEAQLPSDLSTDILYGIDGLCQAAALPEVDQVVTAMVGAAGLKPTLTAIDAGKSIALANKETLVMAGEIVMARAKEKGVSIIPVDSEHSAIFQCLPAGRRQDLSKILLTASGGPFRCHPADRFSEITVDDALAHPNWDMGAKITIDSATLMNKGLEVIEACRLFDVTRDQIEVVVHPESIVHSMVAFKDGSVIGQMGVPDMRGAIAFALTAPERLDIAVPPPNFFDIKQLTFEPPDLTKFPCLKLAYEALGVGGTAPAVLNAANEEAVYAFLNRTIGFTEIPVMVEAALAEQVNTSPDLEAIVSADQRARRFVQTRLKRR